MFHCPLPLPNNGRLYLSVYTNNHTVKQLNKFQNLTFFFIKCVKTMNMFFKLHWFRSQSVFLTYIIVSNYVPTNPIRDTWANNVKKSSTVGKVWFDAVYTDKLMKAVMQKITFLMVYCYDLIGSDRWSPSLLLKMCHHVKRGLDSRGLTIIFFLNGFSLLEKNSV